MSVPNSPTFDESGIRPFCSDQSLEFYWIPPQTGPAYTGFTLACPEASISNSYSASTTYVQLTGLTNGQDYTFYVTADNENGSSVPAYFRTVQPGHISRSPIRITYERINSTKIYLSWLSPSPAADATVKWYVMTATDPSGNIIYRNVSGTKYNFIFDGLTAGIAYTFKIYAVNDPGYSYPVAFTTYQTLAVVSSLQVVADSISYNYTTGEWADPKKQIYFDSAPTSSFASYNEQIKSVVFNGSNYLYASTVLSNMYDLTATAWINIPNNSNSNSIVFSAGYDNILMTNDYYSSIYISKFDISCSNSTLITHLPSFYQLSNDTPFNSWTHIALRYNNLNHSMSFFKNGINVSTIDVQSGGNSYNGGGGGGGGGRFGGGGGSSFANGTAAGGGSSYYDSAYITLLQASNAFFPTPGNPTYSNYGWGANTFDSRYNGCNGAIIIKDSSTHLYEYCGSTQIYTVSSGTSTVDFEAIGAGGGISFGGFGYAGGGGAYMKGTVRNLTPGSQLTLIVPAGAQYGYVTPTYGGGGSGSLRGPYPGGQGGGRAAIQYNGIEILTVGGGGGAGASDGIGNIAGGAAAIGTAQRGQLFGDDPNNQFYPSTFGQGASPTAPGNGGIAIQTYLYNGLPGYYPYEGSNRLFIGNVNNPYGILSNFQGQIAQLAFFSTALTDLQIYQNYSSSKAYYGF